MRTFIIDMVPLQTSNALSPLHKGAEALAKAVLGWEDVKFLATHKRPLPDFLQGFQLQVIYALPNVRRPLNLIACHDRLKELLDNLRRQQRPWVRGISLEWNAGGSKNRAASLKYGTQSGAVPAAHDRSKPPSSLEALAIDALQKASPEFILVDGGVAADIDIMRSLVSTLKHDRIGIVVVNAAPTLSDPQVISMTLSEAGIRELAVRARLCLFVEGVAPKSLCPYDIFSLGSKLVEVRTSSDVVPISELECRTMRIKDADSSISDLKEFFASMGQWEGPVVPARPRVALISPMFPDLGGPPHSSLDLACELSKVCDLDIYTDSVMMPSHINLFNRVQRIDLEFDADHYDEVFYVLGNHYDMYSKILSLNRIHGGVIIQHDAHMIDFLYRMGGKAGLDDLIFEETTRTFSFDNASDLIGKLEEVDKPLLSTIFDKAAQVVVHTEASRSVISANYDVHVEHIPVGMPYSFEKSSLSRDARLEAKRALSIDPSLPTIISFGEVHLSKGARQCLLSIYELKTFGIDFRFYFVGPISSEFKAELELLIDHLDLADEVEIVGGVSEADYMRYLQAGDIVLQIRQVPFGQLSGALLDAVSAGMHGVSSESLARAIDAPETISRINDRASPFVCAEALRALIISGSYCDRPGPGWEQFVSEHGFSKYAQRLIRSIFN